MPSITPCLWFDNQAEEAANFYISVFGSGQILGIERYVEGSPSGMPAGSVMTVSFELGGQRFTGLNGGPMFTFSEAVSFEIPCVDQAEVDHYWSRLTEGGEGPVRMGQGQVRIVLAGSPESPSRTDEGSGSGQGATRHGRDDEDEEDRYRGARTGRRRVLNTIWPMSDSLR